MSEGLQLRLSLHHHAARLLRPLALILQRALRGLGLRLAPAFRRPRRPRSRPPQVLHLEDRAGGFPSEMVVVRQSEPPTATLGRSIAAFCIAGAAETLTDSENSEERDILQTPEVASSSKDFEETGWLMTPVREERGAMSSQLVTGFYFSTSMPD